MKTAAHLGMILALLVSASAANALGPVPLPTSLVMNFRLQATLQKTLDEPVRPNVTRSTTEEVRITNKDMLKAMLQFALLPAFPAGTQLVTDGAGNLLAVGPDGSVLATNPFLTASTGAFTQSLETPATSQIRSWADLLLCNFASLAIQFDLQGLLEKNQTTNNKTDVRSYRATLSNLVGTGALDGTPALFVGEISGKRPPFELE